MSIIRKSKKDLYSSISRKLLQDASLSFACKGMLAYLLSHADEWECRVSDIERQGNIGEHARRSLMKEAEKAGYLTFTRERNEKGQFTSAYTLHEIPVPESERTRSWENPLAASPDSDEPPPDDPGVDEPAVADGGDIHISEVRNSDLHISEDTAAVTTGERAMEETAAVREIAVTSEKAYSEAMSLDVTVREACGLSNVWDNGTERRVCSTVSALQAEGFTIADVKAYRATRKKTPNLSYLLGDMIAWRNATSPMPVKTGPVFNKPANWDSLPSLEKKSILARWAKETFPQTAIV